ncbi:hypothetical protein ACIRO1_46375 [Streptomyces sp. NPDC102381]|uniref:hypothetical protein n=1 Tax=Streptomyces sp. NPDC102381 TaxID=3366164 RepID=UPI003805F713
MEELVTLAGAAATAVVSAMVTEGWTAARDGVVSLWQRVRPGDASQVARDLDNQVEVVTARADHVGALEATRRVWEGRLITLLMEHPESVEDVRHLVESLCTAPGASGGVTFHVEAHDHARVFQVSGDQHYYERGE